MFKRIIRIFSIIVTFILLSCYSKNVIAKEIPSFLADNTKSFNITLSDTQWTNDENTFIEPGEWKELNKGKSYMISSKISKSNLITDGYDIKSVKVSVTYGKLVDLQFDGPYSKMGEANRTMNSTFFQDYKKEPIGLWDCSDRGYPDLFLARAVKQDGEYFKSTEIFYGIAKGYFIVFVFNDEMKTNNPTSESWGANVFYSWLDRTPKYRHVGIRGIFDSPYTWLGILIVVVALITIKVVKNTKQKKAMREKYKSGALNISLIKVEDEEGIFKYCTSCGHKTESDSKYCNSCGVKLD